MFATIIIAAVIFGLMAWVIISEIKKSKRGEKSCGCGCSGCSSASICHGSHIKEK